MNLRLKELIEEATQALSRLDAQRLAELALSCEALNRARENPTECDLKPGEASGAASAMDVFSRVLGAAGANLEFMTRLNKPERDGLEYRPEAARRWNPGWKGHGNN